MKNPSWSKRSLCLLLGVLLILLSAWVPGAAAQTKEELEAELAKTEQRIREQQNKVAELRSQQADQEKLLPALEEQIEAVEAKTAIVETEIDRLNQVIDGINARIESIKAEIGECERKIDEITLQTEEKDREIKVMQQQLMERLRQQYIAGPVSNLQLLLSSPDLSSFLTVSEYISRQAEQDELLRENLERDMARLKELQDDLAGQQATLELKQTEQQKELAFQVEETLKLRSEKQVLEAEQEKISSAQKEIFDIIEGLEVKTKEANRIIEKTRREQEEFERQLDALVVKKLASGEIIDSGNSGQMIWPFPYSGCYITSTFNANEEFRTHTHKGLDISIADKSKDYYIVAALDGTIVDFGFNKSMGNYVMIYHGYYEPTGKRIKTTYMHMKSINSDIKANMQVQAGKALGIMGSTGNSTGPHLHFQINEYTSETASTPVDPLRYVKNPY